MSFWQSPHAKKMAEEQARLDKRSGATSKPSQQQAASDEGKKSKKDPWEETWFGRNWWTVLLIIAGLVVGYFALFAEKWSASPMKDAGSWAWSHWFWVLIFALILYLLIKKVGGTAAKALQTSLILALVALFLVIPIWNWMAGWFEPEAASATAKVVPTSAPVSDWSKVTIPASGKSERIPVPPGMRVSVTGQKISVHTIYENGTECSQSSEGQKQSCPDGLVIGVYITNMANKKNTISYAYEKN